MRGRLKLKTISNFPGLMGIAVTDDETLFLSSSKEHPLFSLNKRRSIFPETFTARPCFPNFSQFPIQETLFPVSYFFFRDANHAYATRQGILTKIRACENLQKFCEHEQASTRLIFASNWSKGQILRALSTWMGSFDTPYHHSRSEY